MSLLGPVRLRAPRELQEANVVDEHFKYLLSEGRDRRIIIRHPGYNPNEDILFLLNTPDHASAGVHFGLVLDACAIIADNRRDGWLSTDREGIHRVKGDLDHILSNGDYWYNVPSDDAKWPIVTCFQDWQFPSSLPPSWQRVPRPRFRVNTAAPSMCSAAVFARDVSCRVSAHYTGTEVAHICQREESEWFFANGMSRFNKDMFLMGQSQIDDHSNLILMRSDIHRAFDDGRFILYPKDATGFSLHMMQPSSDLGILYHNAKMHPIAECRPEFLYARFAWVLFRSIYGFLAMPADRAVISVKSGPGSSERTRVLEIKNSLDIQERLTSSRSRSPRKRKPRGVDIEERDDEGGYKRRRCDTETASVDTPLLETDLGTLQQSRGSAHTPVADEENRRIQQLRDEHLQAQRPRDFVPFTGSAFEGTSDAKTVLERLGFEIVEDL